MPPTVDKILQLFRDRGGSRYGGEDVSQLEHALQAAMFAEQSGADESLIAAALLHDVGHLLHNLPDHAPDAGIDDQHEELAARYLARLFGPAVVEPVRLHVPAKRYLSSQAPGYILTLSIPSVQSLHLQGGPMTDEEAATFRQHPHFAAAVRLRRWDEAAKVPNLPTPDLDHFAAALRACAGRD